MNRQESFEVIIIGGSYAGLSAALALGRSLRKVLVIDNGNPCNKQTPYSHNFLTNDGEEPFAIREKAKQQLQEYPTLHFFDDTVKDVEPGKKTFDVLTKSGKKFIAQKLLFATGIADTLPHTKGLAECWGISVLHCPYCHGYEVKKKNMGVIGNGDMGFEMAKTISHWAKKLTLYTNGKSTLTPEEVKLLNDHDIEVVENEIEKIEHEGGRVTKLHFKDTPAQETEALFTQLPFIQQCSIPEKLGCKFNEHGFIQVSKTMETSVPDIYAAGDCLTFFRSVANAVAAGNKAGAMINKQLIEEKFQDIPNPSKGWE